MAIRRKPRGLPKHSKRTARQRRIFGSAYSCLDRTFSADSVQTRRNLELFLRQKGILGAQEKLADLKRALCNLMIKGAQEKRDGFSEFAALPAEEAHYLRKASALLRVLKEFEVSEIIRREKPVSVLVKGNFELRKCRHQRVPGDPNDPFWRNYFLLDTSTGKCLAQLTCQEPTKTQDSNVFKLFVIQRVARTGDVEKKILALAQEHLQAENPRARIVSEPADKKH